MRNQKGLSVVEASLILLAIIIVGSVGCSRQKAGKNLGNVGEASEPGAKQIRQQKGQPEKTDETADWITYVSQKGGFSLRYPRSWAVGPKNSKFCADIQSTFAAGAADEFVADCGTEYFGQVYVSSQEGNQLSNYELKTNYYPYQNISIQKVTADDINGTRETGMAIGQGDERFAMPGLPDGTRVVNYLFYVHGKTYAALYTQEIDEPDISRDFELMVTKTLKFNN